MIITIDGLIATGKSTVAKRVAEEIGFIFYDTGAMFRCVTYALLKHNIDLSNPEQVKEFLSEPAFEIKVKLREHHYFVGNKDVTQDIRTPEITQKTSEVATLEGVREHLQDLQRTLAQGVNVVFEGRDMGTVVFPDAEVKVFLIGTIDERARRRYDELHSKFPERYKDLTMEKVMVEINTRDRRDMDRAHSPLRQAADATLIDTTQLSIDDVVCKILDIRDNIKTKHELG